MPAGRPSIYSDSLANEVCKRIAQGRSLRSICQDEDMPDISTIFDWIHKKEDFSAQYAKAREQSTEAHNEMLLDLGEEAIALAQSVDPKASGAVVQAVKLKADNLKWVMSKMKPKKYGDKIDMTTNGKDLPIPILATAVKQNYVHSNNGNTQDNDNAETNTGSAGGDLSEQNNIDTPILDTLSTER